eukprot:SAG31_NODE_2220_length_6157_cov_4.078244_9_plen_118_part_00
MAAAGYVSKCRTEKSQPLATFDWLRCFVYSSIDAVFNGDLGRDGWPFAWGYGLSAVLIHLRHLLNPILYGWLWRRWASQLSASTSVIVTAKQQEIDEEKSATECGPQQPKAPGEVGV